jgi:nicotinate-nucleotide adenylyltransferase
VNTGIFGGTFDPPHTGHLIVAQDAALALGLDRILFVPAAQPPHKQGETITARRCGPACCELAVEGDARFAMDTLELERSGPSYTVDTLRSLTERLAGHALDAADGRGPVRRVPQLAGPGGNPAHGAAGRADPGGA